ncbi:MAG: DUF2169 domain-containing protein [Polyangiaceae bacterium]|nr:DUF2169 domain-containing protein [Polyangiaceae bacterium]
MEVVTKPPFVATAFGFQPAEGVFALTIVAKLTLLLVPGVCAVSSEAEEIHESEGYWDDDPKRSLYVPSDLAPLKRKAEVLLVGSAFAPNGRPVQSLHARIAVGEIDKVIQVFGPRLFTATGDLRLGSAWTKMPLRYERAPGGPDTWNPVGVVLDGARDPYGQKHLPNLQPAAVEWRDPEQHMPPVGFGPIPSTWPSRVERLAGRDDIANLRDALRRPLGDDFDAAFFQDAPFDQQLASLRADQSILLENLHPEHERLNTRLPGIKPIATVELAGEAPREIALEADTLWIDTDRARCTLTFRAHFGVSSATPRGRVHITSSEGETRNPTPVGIRLAIASPGERVLVLGAEAPDGDEAPAKPLRSAGRPHQPSTDDVAREITAVQEAAPPSPQLPFSPAKKPDSVPAPANKRARAASSAVQSRRSGTEEFVVTPEYLASAAGPAWLASAGAPPAPPPPPPPQSALPFGQEAPTAPRTRPPTIPPAPGMIPPPPGTPAVAPTFGAPPPFAPPPTFSAQPVAEPPPLDVMMRAPVAAPVSLSNASNFALAAAIAPVSAAPSVSSSSPPVDAGPVLKLSDAEARSMSAATSVGVLAASNAAAGPAPKRKVAAKTEEPEAGKAESADYLEVLWYDRAIAPRLRDHAVFGPWMKPPPKAPPPQQGKPPPQPPSPEAIEKAEKADLYNILSKDPAAAEGANATKGDDGEAPLALLGGTLAFPFDEVETLKTTVAVAKPLAPADKRLKELLDLAAELLKSDMEAAEAAPGLTSKIREAWLKANRSHPAQYIDNRVEQKLLEARKYQKRNLLDEEWIRALLTVGSNETLTTYVPVKLTNRLPLYARFQVKLLAELYPQQDPEETSEVALKVKAIARVAARPKLTK